MASFDDFANIDIRVGTILSVDEFPEAKKPAYILQIDLGPEVGIKKSSARITDLYVKENLVGRQVICVTNIGVRKVGPFESEVLTTGFYRDDGAVVLAIPDSIVANGTKLA